MKTSEIRRRWLEFFEQRGHTVVPSASLISDDPNLLFTIAGMVPFIPYLSGIVPAPWPRATSVQKVIRTVDIEEVGKTPRHGTFFQMNGNFSFGDYFKAEAINYAWEFLTNSEEAGGLGFDPERLWVTIYEEDDEANELWLKLSSLPQDRIQRLGRDTNYWHTGQDGPGGPCSEIFYDMGPEYGVDGGPATDDDRYVEIWNLVFMQYQLKNVQSQSVFEIVGDLPQKNIDTGMGLERVAFLKQGVENMYEIDEVRPVLDLAASIAGVTYGTDSETDIRLRIIADHIRSALMLISDGVSPSNEARGYILRRILRRAIRSLRLLGVERAVFPELFVASKDAMKDSYPEVAQDFERILRIASAEEASFLKTLSSGMVSLEQEIAHTRDSKSTVVDGTHAFMLHDSFGFPIDLTVEIVEEAGLTVDRSVFDALMQQQRDRAREDAKSKRGTKTDTSIYADVRGLGETVFLGYDELETESRVIAIIRDGQSVRSASESELVEVILDTTPLYAEAGGQDSDQGVIFGDGFELEVLDVQNVVQGLVSHFVRVTRGEVHVDAHATARVDAMSRFGANQAHTATHVVHAALRQILGPTAHQAGSYNKPGYMRLDFSWTGGLSETAQSEIEDISNIALRDSLEVSTQRLSLDTAKELGAMALFGEKYGDTVRMVEINGAWSRELCGGTHVDNSSQVGIINVVSESSIGSSARRIEALVGFEAFKDLAVERTIIQQLSQDFKVPKTDLIPRIQDLSAQLKRAENRIQQLEQEKTAALIPDLLKKQVTQGQFRIVSDVIVGVQDSDQLRSLVLDIKNRLGAEPAVIILAAEVQNKPVLIVAANASAIAAGIHSGNLVKIGSAVLGGGGGGKPDMAQGGGNDTTKLSEAIVAVQNEIR